jgi:hypothetical protein
MRSIAALFLLLLTGHPAHAHAQAADTVWQSGPWIAVKWNEDWAAITVCATRPTTWTNSEVDERDRQWVDVHEAQHRADYEAHGGCAATAKWVEEAPMHRVELEARAYCVGATWEFQHGRFISRQEAIWKHAEFMGAYFGFPRQVAAAFIAGACIVLDAENAHKDGP